MKIFTQDENLSVTIAGTPQEAGINVASNAVSIPERPLDRLWRTNDTTNQTLVLHLGSQKVVDGIAIINTNATTVRVYGNNTADLTTPESTSADLATAAIGETNRRNLFYDPAAGQSFNSEYIIIELRDGVTDGASSFFVGSIVLSDAADQMNNPRYGVRIVPQEENIINNFRGGGSEVINIGDKYVSIEADFQVLRDSVNIDLLTKKLVLPGGSKWILIALSDGTFFVDTSTNQYVFLVRQGSPISYTISNARIIVTGRANFRELI